jgi:anthranilate phosphoribosyltransferase
VKLITPRELASIFAYIPAMKTSPVFWNEIFVTLASRTDLTSEQAHWAMRHILSGETPNETIKTFLIGIQAKGERVCEIEGFLSAILENAEKLPISRLFVDPSSTGGDGANTMNISAVSAIIAHAAGVPVVMQGARSVTDQGSSADVLEALGINIDLNAGQVEECVQELGIGFCLVPKFHPSVRFADQARSELGPWSLFNLVTPLANPAQPGAVAIGVSKPSMLTMMADVLLKRDVQGFVFRGDNGLDEITLSTTSTIIQLDKGREKISSFDPRAIGIDYAPPESLRGANPSLNAKIVKQILSGEKFAARESALLNSAVTIAAYRGSFWKSIEAQFSEGYEEAREALDSGKAMDSLESWQSYTEAFTADEVPA